MIPIFYLYNDWTGLQSATEQGMNWDMATFPIWDENNPFTPMVGGQWVGITDFSDQKNEAFQIIEFLLSSEEINTILQSLVSVPYNSEAAESFINEIGLDKELEDKNIDSLFKHPTLDKQSKRSKYEPIAYSVLVDHLNEF